MRDAIPSMDRECFYIAPIGDEGWTYASDLMFVCFNSLLAVPRKETGLSVVRADEITSPGLITLQAIQHVLGAKAVVADLRGRNPNVFNELAVRHTASLQVVIESQEGEDLLFDIAQMRTIFSHQNLESADDHCASATG